jgi:hypothetical protein
MLQLCLVYINTLLIQRVLAAPYWAALLTVEDLRALTPLVYANVNPYDLIHLHNGPASAHRQGGGVAAVASGVTNVCEEPIRENEAHSANAAW